MDLYEYQARDVFEKYGVPVLAGIVADRLHELGGDIPRALDVPSLRTGISAMTVALMAYLAKGA